MAKINVDLEVENVSCTECQYFDYEISWCALFGEEIIDDFRCETCLQHEVKESEKNDKVFDEMQKRCNLDLDLEEFKNFKQIRDKLADTEKNLAIAQDDRKFLKKENARLSVENTELKEQLADLQANNEKIEKMNDFAHVLLGQAIRHIDVDEQLDRYMQASKEGAQEFAKKLKSKLHDLGDGGEKGAYLTENDIDNFLKEFLK